MKSKTVYKSKIPEIESTIELIKLLKKSSDEEKTVVTKYSLCDTIFANAEVKIASSLPHIQYLIIIIYVSPA